MARGSWRHRATRWSLSLQLFLDEIELKMLKLINAACRVASETLRWSAVSKASRISNGMQLMMSKVKVLHGLVLKCHTIHKRCHSTAQRYCVEPQQITFSCLYFCSFLDRTLTERRFPVRKPVSTRHVEPVAS